MSRPWLLPLVVVAFGAPCLVLGIRQLYALFTLERTRYPEAWERDGRPGSARGLLGDVPTRSLFATQRCSWAWLFKTPEWAASDREALLGLRRLRWFAVLWNLVIMPAYVASLFVAIVHTR